MNRTDYTRITYAFLAIAIIIMSVGCLSAWALVRSEQAFKMLPGSTEALRPLALYLKEVLGALVTLSFVGFFASLFLGLRVAAHERENDAFKDKLISIASHQLKGPIAIIRAYVEEMRLGGTLAPSQADAAAHLDATALSMLATVNDILDLSHLELGRFHLAPKALSLTDLVRAVTAELTPIAKRRDIELAVDAPEQLSATLDEAKITQAIRNIVENAIKYAFEHTRVRVAVKRIQDSGIVTVTNTGIGIPEASQKKLFGEFYRAANAAKAASGTGLGLYIVKSIIEQSGGSISFTSVENGETEFTIRLPITG